MAAIVIWNYWIGHWCRLDTSVEGRCRSFLLSLIWLSKGVVARCGFSDTGCYGAHHILLSQIWWEHTLETCRLGVGCLLLVLNYLIFASLLILVHYRRCRSVSRTQSWIIWGDARHILWDPRIFNIKRVADHRSVIFFLRPAFGALQGQTLIYQRFSSCTLLGCPRFWANWLSLISCKLYFLRFTSPWGPICRIGSSQGIVLLGWPGANSIIDIFVLRLRGGCVVGSICGPSRCITLTREILTQMILETLRAPTSCRLYTIISIIWSWVTICYRATINGRWIVVDDSCSATILIW